MHKHMTAAALLCLLSTTAHAQKATATGTGVGISESTSTAGAVAISGTGGNSSSVSQGGSATGGAANATGGQGGRGGSAKALSTGSNSSSNFTVNNPASTRNESVVSGTTTSNVNSHVSGTQTLKNVPSMVAPGLAAAGLETCLGSASGGVSAVGFGVSGGSTYRDEDCTARLDARTLFSMGLKSAAAARLCARPDIWRSMPDICERYWPRGVPYPAGIAVAAPLVAPSGTYMSASIRVIDGRDGVEKDCTNYSATKQKCYQWAGEPARRQRSAALTPAKSQVKPQPKKPPAVEAIETAAPTPDNK